MLDVSFVYPPFSRGLVSGLMLPSVVRRWSHSCTAVSPEALSFSSTSSNSRSSSCRYFSIDVECVAVGYQHNARAVGQISLVDELERVLLNIYVKPDQPVVSYLTPLTGLTHETLHQYGVSLKCALDTLRHYLPSSAVLVGQNIGKDVAWLDLEEGIDFESMVDLAGLYKVWNARFGSFTIFSLEHLANVILGLSLNGCPHNAVDDAMKSIRLFNYYRQYRNNSVIWEKKRLELMETQKPLSFSKRHPRFEGVCMGNRRLCTCGAPFLG